jgi:hypothetical protein
MEIEVRGVKFQVDDNKDGPAFFILGVRKSGSSMLNRVAQLLSRYNGYKFVDVAGSLFSNNVRVGEWIKDRSFGDILRPGNVYGGFRNCPLGAQENDMFVGGKKVLLVRDPRDALVSEYFSNAYSHSLPEAQGVVTEEGGAREGLLRERQKALATTIDEYVISRAKMMGRTLNEYMPLIDDDNLVLLKYETIIFAKEAMIGRMVRHFGWQAKPKQLEAILRWVDVRPEKEDPQQFIRKVTPGDHKDKLQKATIARLNRDLRDVLEKLEYI